MCALVLQAGMPVLAAGAAKLRGVAVGEICEVYGVAMPPMAAAEHAAHAHHHHAGHLAGGVSGDAAAHVAQAGYDPGIGHSAGHGSHEPGSACDGHCPLTALGALASLHVPITVFGRAPHAVPDVTGTSGEVFRDATATWAARLKHGPPARA